MHFKWLLAYWARGLLRWAGLDQGGMTRGQGTKSVFEGIAWWRLQAETANTSEVSIAFRAISLISTRAITSLIDVVRISAVPSTSLQMSEMPYLSIW